MFIKRKRVIDKKLMASFKDKTCLINDKNCLGDVCAHHLKSQGSGGDDIIENLIPVCIFHHNEIHMIGSYTFKRKYRK
jgi:hypothetical protein